MADGDEPVLLVGWHEKDTRTSSYATHHRRMELLRQLLRERFARNSVLCRTALVPRPWADPGAVKRLIAGLTEERASVVIACEWDIPDEDLAELAALHRSDAIRLLMLTTDTPRGGLPTVLSHQSGIGAELAHHCLGAGYRRLLYLSPFVEPWSDARAEGVLGAARTSKVRVHIEPVGDAPAHLPYFAMTADAQHARLRICLARGLAALGREDDATTAIIACNDRIALDARDMMPGFAGGWAGFDDTTGAAHADLTSARQPLAALAERTVALALRLRDGGRVPSITEVPWELVARASTRRERTTQLIKRPPAPDRRIDNATVAPLQLCPPAVLVGWGRLDRAGETATVQAVRLAGSRDVIASGLQRGGIEAATLRIDLIDDVDAVKRQMDRAARRIIEGGARLAVIQELKLTDEAEAALAAAEAAGNLRVLRVMCGSPPTDQPAVTYDQGAGGALAASHCLRQGYRRMLYLSPSDADWAIDRGLSARRALLLASGGLSSLLLVPEAGAMPFGEWLHLDTAARTARISDLLDEGLERLLATEAEHSPPAIIASHDTVALDLLGVLRTRGLRPGVDVGVVGFDDLPRTAAEGLTSLVPPVAAMGAEASRIALRMLKGEPVPRRTCLPWTLVPRASTARG